VSSMTTSLCGGRSSSDTINNVTRAATIATRSDTACETKNIDRTCPQDDHLLNFGVALDVDFAASVHLQGDGANSAESDPARELCIALDELGADAGHDNLHELIVI
jgi:hypothetical protein